MCFRGLTPNSNIFSHLVWRDPGSQFNINCLQSIFLYDIEPVSRIFLQGVKTKRSLAAAFAAVLRQYPAIMVIS
jgi:hypothetical protein